MERITDITILIGELMAYGMENGLVAPADEVFEMCIRDSRWTI